MSSESFTITIDGASGTVIPIAVTKKRVKNLNLRITPSGQVRISAPPRASRASIEDFAWRHRSWIIDHLARQAERQVSGVSSCDITPDSLVPLWGAQVPAAAIAGDAPDTSSPLRQETFSSFIGAGSTPFPSMPASGPGSREASTEGLAARIRERYRNEVARVLPGIVHGYERKMGVSVARWSIRSMKTRWGSCTPRARTIRIALELAQYPPASLDMVVAHELVHLMEPSHNERFHMLLDCYCPDNHALAQRLKMPPVMPDGTEP